MKTQPTTELHLQQITDLLRLRWKMIASAGIIGASATLAIGLIIPPRYTAKAQIIIDADGANTEQVLDDAAIETRVELLLSPKHLQRVLDSFEVDPEPRAPSSDRVARAASWAWSGLLSPWADAPVADAKDNETESDPAAAKEGTSAHSDLVDKGLDDFDRHINAFKERRSRLISVTFTSSDPATAAAVANRTVQLYIDTLSERASINLAEARRIVETRIPAVRAEVEKAEAALQKFRANYGMTDASRTDALDQDIAEITRQLALAKADLTTRQSRSELLQNIRTWDEGIPVLIEVLHDPSLGELYQKMRPRAEPATSITGALPQGDKTGPQQELRQKIDEAVKQNLMQLAGDIEVAEARVRYFEQRLANLQDAMGGSREADAQLRELQRRAATSADLYKTLLAKQQDLRSREAPEPDARIVSPATVPDQPSSPNPLLFVLPGLVLATIIGGLWRSSASGSIAVCEASRMSNAR